MFLPTSPISAFARVMTNSLSKATANCGLLMSEKFKHIPSRRSISADLYENCTKILTWPFNIDVTYHFLGVYGMESEYISHLKNSGAVCLIVY